MALSLLNSVCSLATKLTATIPSSPSSSSSPSLLSPTPAVKEDLEKLQRTLRRIEAVLADAESREILDESVKLWVKELKEVAYDAEDALEEYQYELLRIQVESRVASAEASRKRKREQEEQQVRDLNSILSQLSIPERIRNIRERFDEISKDREALHLREEDGIRRPDVSMNWPQPTSSHVDESGIFGREQDKDKVIEMLLSDESCRFSVIPIVGMGGLGKTTLAQLVYNDQRVKQYFDCTCWVCVSENFDVSRLTKEMIESISKESCNLTQLNALQDILKEKVKGKKVLLVLDDVWNEQQGPWDSFRAPLDSVKSIRIIVTTRNDPVAKIMQTVSPYHPACLSNDQCWSLFRHRAFGGRDHKDYPHLEGIGRKIIEKCGRLPLSVKTIGGLLHYEFDEDRWTDILGSDLWDLDQAKRDILPALMLSYRHLPAHLKPCFLFSSLFPKDYVFNKNQLIALWIAQGFILPYGKERLEDTGSRYFDELQGRSLFQSAFHYDYDDPYFVLHDAIHDVARSISDNEYLSIILESDEERHDIPKEVRHLFVKSNSSMPVDHLKFFDPKALRTLIVEEKFRHNSQSSIVNLDGFGCLRAVELRSENCLTSVSNLKHLRHLYVRNCGNVSHLPELPRHLYNLRYLNIDCFKVNQEIFTDIANLVSLQRLSLCGPVVFPGDVSVENNELGLMKRACYPPSSNLCKYVESDGIIPCLRELTITDNEELSRLPVLPSSLQSLTVNYCTKLTSLSQSLQSLTSLRKLKLSNCHRLQFGQQESLPSKLEDVCISDCSELLLVSGLKNLTSLRKLHLSNCRRLQFGQQESLPSKLEDVHISYCRELLLVTGLKNLTSLRKLHLSNCHRLQFGQEESLPSKLEDVRISDCSELLLVTGLKNLTSLRKLYLSNCRRLQFGQEESLPSKLEDVHINDCSELLLVTGLKNLTSLRKLHLWNCRRLQFGQQESLPSKLEDVCISDCSELLLVTGLKNLTSLRKLYLSNCRLLQCGQEESLPTKLEEVHISYCSELLLVTGLKNLTSLRKLHLSDCHQLQFGQQESLPSKLEDVHISDCSELLLVTGLKNLTSLRKLHLSNCRRLQFGQEESLPSKLEDVHISDCSELLLVSGLKNLTSLRKLHLSNCHQLQFGQEESLPSKLEDVHISYCRELLLVTGLKNLTSLRKLHLSNCRQLQFGQEESLPSKLEDVHISNCLKLMLVTGLQNMTSLKKLHLSNCRQLQFGQEETLPSKLEDVYISNFWKLMLVTGLQNMTSLKSLVLERCPCLQISPDEFLPCTPGHLKITDCLGLSEWCKRGQIQCNREISKIEELNISSTSKITDYYGVDNLSSLKRLCLNSSLESYLPADEWLPPTVQTLEVCSSENLKSLPLSPNLSSLQQLIIQNCRELTSIVGVQNLNSLKELVIINCPELHLSSNEYPSSLQSLEVNGCESFTSLPLHQSLSSLEKLIIIDCLKLTSVVGMQNLNSLKELVIRNCHELHLLPDEYFPSSLHSLEVNGYEGLRSLPLHQNLSSFEKLKINGCLNLTSVVGIQNLNSLKELVIKDCPALQLSPNEYLPCSLQSLNVSDCKSLRSLPLLHHKMSAFDMLKLSNCSSLTDVCGLSDVPSLRYVIIWDCPEVLLSSEERLRITCPPQLELATGCLRPKQSDTMAPAKKIDAAVGNKDQFLHLGLPMDYASNSLMELPLSTDINAEPQQT